MGEPLGRTGFNLIITFILISFIFGIVISRKEKYDIVFRRVGGLAGKCYRNNGTNYSIQSHYFIKFDNEVVPLIDTITEKINNHIFPSNTLGPRSLSKSEANIVINDLIKHDDLI